MTRTRVAATAGLFALAFSGTAMAATPLSPTDGQTVTTAQPAFQIAANTSTASDGQQIEQGIVVYVYASDGSLSGKCFGAETSPDNDVCNLGSSLPNGTYAWHFIWTNHSCPDSTPYGCSSNPKTSPTYHFTVAAATPTTTTTSSPATTPGAPKPLLVAHGKTKIRVAAHLCVGKTCVGRVGKRLLEYRAGRVPKFMRWLS